jgi:flavoprotein
VDIHDAVREGTHKICPYDTHESGENHEFYFILLQLCDYCAVKRGTILKFTVIDADVRDMRALCTLQCPSIRVVADHPHNLSRYISAHACIND